jgi:hypothetical protein
MSQSARLKYEFGSLNSNTITIDKTFITQATSNTTAVSITTQTGIITTQTMTTPSNAAIQFNVNHPDVTVDSVILANIMNYAGTTGLPNLYIDNPTTGSFVATVQNHHTSGSLNGAIKIAYLIL